MALIFIRSPAYQAVMASCLFIRAVSVSADSCPGAATTIISGVVTDNTCELGAGESVVITASGDITHNIDEAILTLSPTAASISNSGSVDGASYGIHLLNGTSLSGAIINNSGGTVQSNGTALHIWNADVSGGISNSGAITSPAGNGITLRSSTLSSAIVNLSGGAISSQRATSTASDGMGVMVYSSSDVVGGINNSGTIEGAIAIRIINSSNVTGGIVNNGTIQGDEIAINVDNNSDIAGGISNNGSIEGAIGIHVQNLSNISGAISNNASGIIRGTGGTAIILNDASGNAIAPATPIIINNSGLIDGAVTLNNNVLNLNGTSNRITGNVTGTGGSLVNLNGSFSTEADFIGIDSFTINNGARLDLHDGVSLGNAVSNDGTLAIAAGSTATISGDYTQTANGSFETAIFSSSSYGQLVVTGTADLSASNLLSVKISPNDMLTDGAVLNNVLSSGTLITGGPLSVSDSSALWSFAAVNDGSNGIDITAKLASATSSGITEAVLEHDYTQAQGAANTLDVILAGSPTGDMATVISELGALATTSEIATAVVQMLPVLTAGHAQASLDIAGMGGSRVVHDRMTRLRGLNDAGNLPPDKMVWLQRLWRMV